MCNFHVGLKVKLLLEQVLVACLLAQYYISALHQFCWGPFYERRGREKPKAQAWLPLNGVPSAARGIVPPQMSLAHAGSYIQFSLPSQSPSLLGLSPAKSCICFWHGCTTVRVAGKNWTLRHLESTSQKVWNKYITQANWQGPEFNIMWFWWELPFQKPSVFLWPRATGLAICLSHSRSLLFARSSAIA